MRRVRLLSVGELGQPVKAETEGGDSSFLDRPVRLVYTGDFESMDGPVKITDEHIALLAKNHNERHADLSKDGEVPMSGCPPIQLDHSTSAGVTVGRLVGLVSVGKATIEGKEVCALFGTLRALGRENVEKVRDGRWTHVSIGADLDEGKLNELSITPFPAAANAHMLGGAVQMAAKRELVTENESNGYKYKIIHVIPNDPEKHAHFEVEGLKGLDATFPDAAQATAAADTLIKRSVAGKPTKLSTGDGMKEKLKKHLMEHQKLSEKEADDKLGAMNDEDQKKLSAEVDEHDKKMAAADDEKKKTEMSAKREGFAKLSATFKSSASTARLALKKTQLSTRLSGLRAKAKITPAEIKKLDIAKLASMSDEATEAFFSGYDARENVIPVGVLGSSKSMSVADIARLSKTQEMKTLEAETIENMPGIKAARLATGKTPKDTRLTSLSNAQDAPNQAVPGEGGGPTEEGQGEHMKHLSNAHAALEAGNYEEAKAHMKLCMETAKLAKGAVDHDGPTDDKGNAEQLSALTESVTRMEAQFGELVALAGPALGIET